MQEIIIKLLKTHTKLKEIILETPPSPKLGDYAFPCFILSNRLKSSPVEIAKELSKKLKLPKEVEKILATGPYLNFFLNKALISEQTLKQILKEKDKYGSKRSKKPETLMVEFSGPNPFKAFHIGHLRNTVLGESLVRILKSQNHKVIPINYLNDTGTHVSKCIWGLEHLKPLPKIKDKGEFLGQVYTLASEKINTPKKEKEVQNIHKQIESLNPKYLKIQKQGIKDSLNYFNKIYQDLNVKFNKIFYDSHYIDKGKQVVDTLIKKKIAKKDQGAILVNLEKYKLNKVLILKSNETSLYITKDLAMAIDRLNTYKLNRLIYVVGSEQKLHFQQLFKILDLYGFKQASKCFHLSYELVRLPEGRMASRKGKVITYSEIKEELLTKIKKEVNKRHKLWSKSIKQKALEAIFSSTIKFDLLRQGPEKTVIFSIDKALEFEGDTGPYVQYTYARISSILKKAKPSKPNLKLLTNPEEASLISKLSLFPDLVQKAALEYKPYLISNYLLELSHLFNDFYHKYPVLKSPQDIKQARLALLSATSQVLANGLSLLAIQSPKEM